MKVINLLLLSGFLLLLNGCFDNEELPIYENPEGVVLLNGEPVANAEIHFRNHFNPGGFSIGEDPRLNFSFTLNIPSDGHYTGSVFRHGADTVFATFLNRNLEAGQNEIVIPDSLLSNGIIGYEIRSTVTQISTNLFLMHKPDSTLPGTIPLTKTNINGEFTLNSRYLALGQSFNTSSGGGFDITDSLKIIVIQGQNILKIQDVRIAPDQSNFLEITLD